MFELRWLVTNEGKTLQYRYKYHTVVYSYSGGFVASNEHIDLIWSEWNDVKEVKETCNAA